MRRAAWPLREAARGFFRDVYDQVVGIVDSIETWRENVSANLDIHLSSASARLHAVMRVLTVMHMRG